MYARSKKSMFQKPPETVAEEMEDDAASATSSLSRRSSVAAGSLHRASVVPAKRAIGRVSIASKSGPAVPLESDANAVDEDAEPEFGALMKLKPRSSMAAGRGPGAARAKQLAAQGAADEGAHQEEGMPVPGRIADDSSEARRSGSSSLAQKAARSSAASRQEDVPQHEAPAIARQSGSGSIAHVKPKAKTTSVIAQEPIHAADQAAETPPGEAPPALAAAAQQQPRRSPSTAAATTSTGQKAKRSSVAAHERAV